MKLILLVILSSVLFACNTHFEKKYSNIQSDSKDLAMNTPQEHPGKKLMENNCYVCHNPKTAQDKMIAPPFIAVKMHYISENTTKEDFVNAMIEWTKDPSKEKSKMPGAIKKFGLMPYQFYPAETIRQIGDYMFENTIEEPEWFQSHYNEMHGDKPKMKGKKMKYHEMHKNQRADDNKPVDKN